MTTDIISTLQECPDLNGFSDAELEELANISKFVHFEKGREVFCGEHQDKYVFIVADGVLSVHLYNQQSQRFMNKDLFGEIILFNKRGRLGVIYCLEESKLLAIDKTKLLTENKKVSVNTRLKFLQRMGEKMASYFYDEKERTTETLIKEPESEYLEFKASADKYHWDSMIRSVAAFMNTNGGAIICGVEDASAGKLTKFNLNRRSFGKFADNFQGRIKEKLGSSLPNIDIIKDKIQGCNIIRIDIPPATTPVYYTYYEKEKDKDGKDVIVIIERFYSRFGATNRYISKPSKLVEYIHKRFEQENLHFQID